MPKFPSLTSQKVIKILEKKGFVLDRSKGSHRIYIHPVTGKRTVIPFHRKDLAQGTLRDIFKQAGIELEDLQN